MTRATAKRQALLLGLATVLACVLTSALFAAPLLAAEFDFGHRHGENTAPHVHSIDGVLGSAVLGEPTSLGLQLVTLPLAAERAVSAPRPHAPFGPGIRAPPHS